MYLKMKKGENPVLIDNYMPHPQTTDYLLKEGLYTPPLGVWNLGPSMKFGVYFNNSL